MTGTGTQADPYVPSTWAEFVTAVGTASAYVSVPEGTVWDMNDIAPEGISSEITVAAYRVEGNGAEIRNLFFTGGGCFTMPTNPSGNYHSLINLIFSNIMIENGSCFVKTPANPTNWQTLTLAQCKLSGKIIDSAFVKFQAGESQNVGLNRSSLNLEVSGNSTLAHQASSNYGLRFTMSNANMMISGRMAASANGAGIAVNNSVIRGDWNTVSGLYISLSDTASQYSIFDVDIPAGSYLQTQYTVNKVLVNSDKIASGATVSSGFTRVTDAQLHDAAYLNSIDIGFPIGVD